MVRVQQWFGTDCFEMDNLNFRLHSLENTACQRSDTALKKKKSTKTKLTCSKVQQ